MSLSCSGESWLSRNQESQEDPSSTTHTTWQGPPTCASVFLAMRQPRGALGIFPLAPTSGNCSSQLGDMPERGDGLWLAG